MTRKECERAIARRLRDIWEIYQEYYPGGDGLSVIVTGHSAMVFNEHWDAATERELDYYVRAEEVGADAID